MAEKNQNQTLPFIEEEELLDIFDDLLHDVMDSKNMTVDEAYTYLHRHLLSAVQPFKGL